MHCHRNPVTLVLSSSVYQNDDGAVFRAGLVSSVGGATTIIADAHGSILIIEGAVDDIDLLELTFMRMHGGKSAGIDFHQHRLLAAFEILI